VKKRKRLWIPISLNKYQSLPKTSEIWTTRYKELKLDSTRLNQNRPSKRQRGSWKHQEKGVKSYRRECPYRTFLSRNLKGQKRKKWDMLKETYIKRKKLPIKNIIPNKIILQD
jgi:hypothetical protein